MWHTEGHERLQALWFIWELSWLRQALYKDQLRDALSHVVRGQEVTLLHCGSCFSYKISSLLLRDLREYKRGAENCTVYITLAPGDPSAHWSLCLVHVPPWTTLPACLPELSEQAASLWEGVNLPLPTPLSSSLLRHAIGVLQTRSLRRRERVGWKDEREDQSRKHEKAQSTQARSTSLTSTTHSLSLSLSSSWQVRTIAAHPGLWFPPISAAMEKGKEERARSSGHVSLSRWLGPAGNQTWSVAYS